MSNQQVQIFQSADGQLELKVAFDQDTVWLTQAQMAELFSTSTDNVSLHLKNVYATQELKEQATTEYFLVVRQEGKRQVQRTIKDYNLDAVISVGYRVSSTRATQFRIWATRTLKQHLVDGYTLNQSRLQARGVEFEQVIQLLSNTLANQQLVQPEGSAVLSVIADYARSWSLLQGYDEQSLAALPNKQQGIQALHLLYFVIKNHPLADGNKRSGSFLFLWYLRLNQHLLAKPVEQIINDNTLVALALLVAESKPDQKELMIRLVEHFVLLKD